MDELVELALSEPGTDRLEVHVWPATSGPWVAEVRLFGEFAGYLALPNTAPAGADEQRLRLSLHLSLALVGWDAHIIFTEGGHLVASVLN